MSVKTLLTVEEFAVLETAETETFELVEGELTPLASPALRHNKIRSRTERRFETYFERNPIGDVFVEVDCRISDDTVRKPDGAVFLGEKLRLIDQSKSPAPFAPDIAIEVLSPSERAEDLHRKIRDYLLGGSQEVWVFDDANGEVFVHSHGGIRLVTRDGVLESPLLPGFSAAVADLLREP